MPYQENDELQQLEDAISEPALRSIINDAKIYNATFLNQEPNHYDIQDIVGRLDRAWYATFSNRTASVTGAAVFIDHEGKAHPKELNDVVVKTNGFDIIDQHAVTDDGKIVSYKKLVFQLLADQSVLEEDQERRRLNLGIVELKADLDDIFFDFVEPTSERAAAWLGVYHPDLKDDIQRRVQLQDDSSENILQPLQHLELLKDFGRIGNEFARQSVAKFLNSRVRLDRRVPYRLSVDGSYASLNESGELVDQAKGKVSGIMATPERFTIRRIETDTLVMGTIGLSVFALHRDIDHPENHLLIPVDSITQFRSLRSEFFRQEP